MLFSQGNNPSSSSLPLGASSLLQPHPHSASGTGLDRKGKSRAGTPGGSGDFLALDMDGDGGENGLGRGAKSGGQQQMQLMEEQDTYLQSRSTAIESIESTIAELGQIFGQLAGMVAQQGETVQRIDADVTDISA